MTQDQNESLTLSRRSLLLHTAALAAAPMFASCTDADGGGSSENQPNVDTGAGGAPLTTQEPLSIGMLLYPGFTMLDLIGPQSAWGFHGQTHLVYKQVGPVMSDSKLTMNATISYADCPKELDVLFVPGGFGTGDAMIDEDALQFLTDRAPHAKYVTSVCSGSLILAAAGLLDGYRASSHWTALDALAMFDVDVVRERVVIDRNRITGGGVTAGIDFGLVVLAQLRGQMTAEVQELMMEYTPEPPFKTGDSRTAPPGVVAAALAAAKGAGESTARAIPIALERLGQKKHG